MDEHRINIRTDDKRPLLMPATGVLSRLVKQKSRDKLMVFNTFYMHKTFMTCVALGKWVGGEFICVDQHHEAMKLMDQMMPQEWPISMVRIRGKHGMDLALNQMPDKSGIVFMTDKFDVWRAMYTYLNVEDERKLFF